jgi:hypothetical protein
MHELWSARQQRAEIKAAGRINIVSSFPSRMLGVARDMPIIRETQRGGNTCQSSVSIDSSPMFAGLGA